MKAAANGSGRWGMAKFDETFTGALAGFPTTALVRSNGRGVNVTPSGLAVVTGGTYLVMLYAYVVNIAAGARAEVQLLVNAANVLTTNLYVSNAGGQDQSSSHSVLTLAAGDKLSMQRFHSDTGSGRAVAGEMFIQELI